jgi:hypothetical protein
MAETLEFQPLLSASLEIDDEGISRGDGGTDGAGFTRFVADKQIQLLMRENRIGVALGRISRAVGEVGSAGTADVPMIVTVHSHPECRFNWSRLTVDLTPTPGAIVRDMSPLEVRGDKPVEIKTSVGIGLKFETAVKLLSAEVKPEFSQSRTVYYPEIVASGLKSTSAIWDFLALSSDYLHANRELRVLVSSPSDAQLRVRFRMRARVRMSGFAGLIPLLAAKGEIDETYLLS